MVSSLEDIVAEKLRALLQQQIRGRNRCQDVYDICICIRRKNLDLSKIAKYLKNKSAIRGIEPQKSSFNENIRDRAAIDYNNRIRNEVPKTIIPPFDEAWQEILSLVQKLDIPD